MKKISLIPKIEVSYKDMPNCIKDETIKQFLLLTLLILFTILFAIKSLNLEYFLIGIALSIFYTIVLLSWYLPFAFGKVIVVEGAVTEIDDLTRNKSANLLITPIAQHWVRMTYTITNKDNASIKVVRTGKKVKSLDTHVRIYVPTSEIYEKDNDYIVSKVLFTEIIKK